MNAEKVYVVLSFSPDGEDLRVEFVTRSKRKAKKYKKKHDYKGDPEDLSMSEYVHKIAYGEIKYHNIEESELR